MNWHEATLAQRNAACAQFMPKSGINPLRRYDLVYTLPDVDGITIGQIPLQQPTMEAATKWLEMAKSSRSRWAELVGEDSKSGGCPWTLRDHVTLVESTWHYRYTDTPGGAWTLVEQLVSEAYDVTVRSYCRATSVSIAPTSQGRFFLELPRPMPEVVAVAFLMFKGIEITNL